MLTKPHRNSDHKDAILDVQNLSLHYGDAIACNDVSFQIGRGELYALIGPNGAGKSTIAKAITARLKISSGNISVLGKSTTNPKNRKHLGVAPQKSALFDKLTAVENITLAGRIWGMSKNAAMQSAIKLLKKVELDPKDKKLVESYSGGMRQRVNIAASIVHEPALLVLDEPSASLDPLGTNRMNSIIKGLRSDGLSILLISHDMTQVQKISTNVGIMNKGKLIAEGKPQHLINQYAQSGLLVSIETYSPAADKFFQSIEFRFDGTHGHGYIQNHQKLSDILMQLSAQNIIVGKIEARHTDLNDVVRNLQHTVNLNLNPKVKHNAHP